MNPHDRRPVEPEAAPLERLFQLRSATGRIADLLVRSHPLGVELVVEIDGELYTSQVHRQRAALDHDAQEKRAQLLERGWQDVAGPIKW